MTSAKEAASGRSLLWPRPALPGRQRGGAKQQLTLPRKPSQSEEVTCSRSHSKLFLGRKEGTRQGALHIWGHITGRKSRVKPQWTWEKEPWEAVPFGRGHLALSLPPPAASPTGPEPQRAHSESIHVSPAHLPATSPEDTTPAGNTGPARGRPGLGGEAPAGWRSSLISAPALLSSEFPPLTDLLQPLSSGPNGVPSLPLELS